MNSEGRLLLRMGNGPSKSSDRKTEERHHNNNDTVS